MPISDWPLAERPRERLLALGPQHLSDAELVAVCLRTGTSGKSAIDLARELIQRFGGLHGLLGAERGSFAAIKGLGSAKTAQLAAVLELARRCLHEEMRAGDALVSPGAVRDYLRLTLAGREHEVFVVLFLDAQHRVLAVEDTSTTGGSVLTAVDALREAGAEVVGVAVIVERGAAPAIEAAGLPYLAAYSLADLGLA